MHALNTLHLHLHRSTSAWPARCVRRSDAVNRGPVPGGRCRLTIDQRCTDREVNRGQQSTPPSGCGTRGKPQRTGAAREGRNTTKNSYNGALASYEAPKPPSTGTTDRPNTGIHCGINPRVMSQNIHQHSNPACMSNARGQHDTDPAQSQCYTEKAQTPGTVEEHQRQETPTISPNI